MPNGYPNVRTIKVLCHIILIPYFVIEKEALANASSYRSAARTRRVLRSVVVAAVER
jgi:hypothetical protein